MTLWKPPAEFRDIRLSRGLTDETIEYLRSYGEREVIAYWAGTAEGHDFRVARLVRPVAVSGKRFVVVPLEEVARVVEDCHSKGEFLIAQIHTHPADEDHSEVDDCGSVSKREGFVSLVVPHYALLATSENPGWFGYQLRKGEWVEFDVGRISHD